MSRGREARLPRAQLRQVEAQPLRHEVQAGLLSLQRPLQAAVGLEALEQQYERVVLEKERLNLELHEFLFEEDASGNAFAILRKLNHGVDHEVGLCQRAKIDV